MSARSKARKRALDAIFQADLTNKPIVEIQDDTEIEDKKYSDILINGIKEHQVQIDSMISDSLTNWTIDRIPRVDRNIHQNRTVQSRLWKNLSRGSRHLYQTAYS